MRSAVDDHILVACGRPGRHTFAMLNQEARHPILNDLVAKSMAGFWESVSPLGIVAQHSKQRISESEEFARNLSLLARIPCQEDTPRMLALANFFLANSAHE